MKKWIGTAMACIMALGVVFGAAACGEGDNPAAEQVKLATPGGLDISSDGTIYWSKVPNATGYLVTVNGTSVNVTDTSYEVAADVLKEDFTYSVQATADGYLASDAATGKYVAPDVLVAISAGTTEIRSGMTLDLKATVTGAADTSVVWSVVKGGDYVSVDQTGKVTAETVADDVDVVIRATSVARPSRYAEKGFTVVARTTLTQAMLKDLQRPEDSVEFSGSLTIDSYRVGTFSEFESTTMRTILTRMDGAKEKGMHWYGEYQDANNVKQYLYYENVGGIAQQVGLSLENDEEYYPMLDEEENEVTWEASGLYNTFPEVTLSDFEFDEDAWLWKYVGSDKTFAQRTVASANPYDFTPKNLYLDIHGGEVIGFISESESDYKLVAGYRCEMRLSVVINFENVEVPTIAKFPTNDEYHPDLQEAINNMRNLTSYHTEVRHVQYAFTSTAYNLIGYDEYVTGNECFFEDFEYKYTSNDGSSISKTPTGSKYGFKQMGDGLYNSYAIDEKGAYHAIHAVKGSIGEVKPQFKFAAEIFRGQVSIDPETHYQTFYADPVMTSVATQFYSGLTNADALYGIFAARGSATETYLPRITVDPATKRIVSSSFYYDMGMMFGVIEITYDQFNTATVPEVTTFDTRAVPTTWGQLTTTDEDDKTVACDQFIDDNLGEGFADKVPFFGTVLGDCYGFAMYSEASYHPRGGNRVAKTVMFYYDVPLDRNYSIETSIDAVEDWLIGQGFVKNQYGEFIKGTVGIALVDKALDFLIYVWDDTDFQTAQGQEG